MEFFPIFISSSDSDGGAPAGGPRRVKALVALAVGTAIAFGLTLRIMPMMWPILAVIVGVMLVLWLGILLGRGASARAQSQTDAEKRKRGLDGLDMYSLIDRLVDDLDDDELTYLRRRIEDRESDPQPLQEAMETLLKQRTDDRQAGRR
jgi:hypothetical protein